MNLEKPMLVNNTCLALASLLRLSGNAEQFLLIADHLRCRHFLSVQELIVELRLSSALLLSFLSCRTGRKDSKTGSAIYFLVVDVACMSEKQISTDSWSVLTLFTL